MAFLEIRNLHVEIDGKEILKGLDLTVNAGEVHAIMGPNGSGKSTLAYVLAGKADYTPTAGEVLFDGKNIFDMAPVSSMVTGDGASAYASGSHVWNGIMGTLTAKPASNSTVST